MNQLRGVPEIQMKASLWMRIEWEMSNATVKSRRMSIVRSSEAAAIRRSLVIFNRAASA